MEIQGDVRELIQIGYHKENYLATIFFFRQEILSFQQIGAHCLFVWAFYMDISKSQTSKQQSP